MRLLPVLLAAGGAGALALLVGSRKASAASRGALPPSSATQATGRLSLKTTKYHPSDAKTEAERRMEGGVHGAALWRGKKAIDPSTGKRPLLYTLEDALAGKAPYASLAGDPDVWPFGQRVEVDAFPGIVFRVVDTGGNFKGANKQYKIPGTEPVDVCVESRSTKVPTTTGGRIVSGDNFEGGAPVAVANLRGQSVVAGESVPPRTEADHEALARAIESSCPRGTVEEKQAVAWACRNRADKVGLTLTSLLVPEGVFGPRGEQGRDFVSTAREAGTLSQQVAKVVLGLSPEMDPTGGAIDFWNPGQQRRTKLVADAATLLGGAGARVPGEDEVREALAACGLHVCGVVGELELLS